MTKTVGCPGHRCTVVASRCSYDSGSRDLGGEKSVGCPTGFETSAVLEMFEFHLHRADPTEIAAVRRQDRRRPDVPLESTAGGCNLLGVHPLHGNAAAAPRR